MAPSYDGLTFSPVPKAFEPTAAFSIPVTTLHHSTYPAISALRPELSQAGKTVLITGGGTGVGFSIAQGFASAGAAKIILAARRQDVLDNASKKLTAEFPAVEVLVHPLDVSDGESIAALWAWLEGHGLVVDVLVLNAGIASPPVTVGNMGHKNIWEFYKVNVYGHVMLSDYFIKQEGKRAGLGPKVLLNVATSAAWALAQASVFPVYSLTKNSAIMLMQEIAQDVSPDKMRVVSFHPGLLPSEGLLASAKAILGLDIKDASEWPGESLDLPRDFAVWLASSEADFLHGRFVEALWDIDELKSGPVRERIDNDYYFLKVGVLGLHP